MWYSMEGLMRNWWLEPSVNCHALDCWGPGQVRVASSERPRFRERPIVVLLLVLEYRS